MKEYPCPMCGKPLEWRWGTQVNSKDGITLFCPHYGCPAQEVIGHGSNVERAYEVIVSKFPKEKK